MKYGLGAILQLAAVVLFALGAFSDTHWTDFLAIGLAAFAGSFLATSLGYGDRTFGTRT
jgi:hypothetical protein